MNWVAVSFASRPAIVSARQSLLAWFVASVAAIVACGEPGDDAAGSGSDPRLALARGWARLSTLDYDGAIAAFSEIENHAEGTLREAGTYGVAVTLLNLPPTTATRLESARARFESLWSGAADDYVRVAAGFHLARYWQLHAPRPDPDRAFDLYLEVSRLHPESRYGQMALCQAVIWDLYKEARPGEEARRRIASWLERIDPVVDPVLRRNLLLCIDAAQLLSAAATPEEMLPILREIARLEPVRDDMQQIVLRRLAFTAERAGDLATALATWKRLAADYPRDANQEFYHNRIAQLEEGAPLHPPTP